MRPQDSPSPPQTNLSSGCGGLGRLGGGRFSYIHPFTYIIETEIFVIPSVGFSGTYTLNSAHNDGPNTNGKYPVDRILSRFQANWPVTNDRSISKPEISIIFTPLSIDRQTTECQPSTFNNHITIPSTSHKNAMPQFEKKRLKNDYWRNFKNDFKLIFIYLTIPSSYLSIYPSIVMIFSTSFWGYHDGILRIHGIRDE